MNVEAHGISSIVRGGANITRAGICNYSVPYASAIPSCKNFIDAHILLPLGRVIGRGLPAGLLSAIHTPGHSAGSLSFLAREPLVRPVASVDTTTEAVIDGEGGVLFSGDHFCFSARLGRLDGMGRYGDDLKEQVNGLTHELRNADEEWPNLL